MQGEGRNIERFNEDGIRTASFPKGNYSEVVPGECDDLQAVVDMSLQSVRSARARKGQEPKYTPDESGLDGFLERCEGYFQRIAEVNAERTSKHALIADIEGLCSWLGITRRTLRRYRERGEKWLYAVDMVELNILACKKQMMLSGQMPPVVGIFDLCNNHGYVSTNQFTLNAEPLTVIENADERQRRLADKYRVSGIPDKLSED